MENRVHPVTDLKPLDICLLQLSESRSGHPYFPYTAGLLQAYALKHCQQPQRLHFRDIIFEHLTIPQALLQLEGVDIAAFSVYCWNIRRSLAIAKALKERQPETVIIMGGPQIPQSDPETFLRTAPWVDVIVLGEGERAFASLLDDPHGQAWLDIPGIAWIKRSDSQETFQRTDNGPRITDLDSIPSPYLTGVFDPLIQAHPDYQWVATWESNRGCPFKCAFCDWGGMIQSRVYQFDMSRLKAEIEWFGQNGVADIFCADANFGMLARDLELAQQMVICKERYGAPHLFQTQMAKNVKLRNLEIQSLLARSGLNPVTAISLQSLSEQTLKAIQRENISTRRFQEIQQYCQQNGIFSYTDLIIGLPGESYDSFADGISQVIEYGQHNRIMFFNAAILPNALMAQPAYRQQHGIESILSHFPGQYAEDDLPEFLEIIIATHTMPRSDWVRMQVLAWMSNFIYFLHKPLQVLMLVLHTQYGLSYRQMIEAFCQRAALRFYPLLLEALNRFEQAAVLFQQGKQSQQNNPYLYSLPNGFQMTPDVLTQLEWLHQDRYSLFYEQAGHVLLKAVLSKSATVDMALFQDALKLSQAHFYELYFGNVSQDKHSQWDLDRQQLHLRYNLWEFYQAHLNGNSMTLKSQATIYHYTCPRKN